MKKISKHLMSLAIVSLLVLPIFAVNAQVDPNTAYGITATNDALNGVLGTSNSDPRETAGKIIQLALGFLGLIAVVIVLFGGFKWMTAAGNEDKVEEAKKVLGAGVIGLFIVLAAWGLSSWVINIIAENIVKGGA